MCVCVCVVCVPVCTCMSMLHVPARVMVGENRLRVGAQGQVKWALRIQQQVTINSPQGQRRRAACLVQLHVVHVRVRCARWLHAGSSFLLPLVHCEVHQCLLLLMQFHRPNCLLPLVLTQFHPPNCLLPLVHCEVHQCLLLLTQFHPPNCLLPLVLTQFHPPNCLLPWVHCEVHQCLLLKRFHPPTSHPSHTHTHPLS